MATRTVFNIPTIDNQLEALARTLGINTDDDSQLAKIRREGLSEGVHSFSFNGKKYRVAHNSLGINSDKTVEYNSSLWSVECTTTKTANQLPHR